MHGNFTDAATFDATINTYKSAGVKLVAIGVERMTGDEKSDRPRFEFCKRAGITNRQVSSAGRRARDCEY